MSKVFFKVPNKLVREWPEVFDEDMLISTMPVAYIHKLQLEFKDGRVWEFNIRDQLQKTEASLLASKLIDTLKEYRESIRKVDFELDVDRLKGDISGLTKKLL